VTVNKWWWRLCGSVFISFAVSITFKHFHSPTTTGLSLSLKIAYMWWHCIFRPTLQQMSMYIKLNPYQSTY